MSWHNSWKDEVEGDRKCTLLKDSKTFDCLRNIFELNESSGFFQVTIWKSCMAAKYLDIVQNLNYI